MNQFERRLNKLEAQHPSGRQEADTIFIVGVEPGTMEETVDTAIIIGRENMYREPGETQTAFRDRVVRAGGADQTILPEKDK